MPFFGLCIIYKGKSVKNQVQNIIKNNSLSWLFILIILSFLSFNETCVPYHEGTGGPGPSTVSPEPTTVDPEPISTGTDTVTVGSEPPIKKIDITEIKTVTIEQSEDSKTYEKIIVHKPGNTTQIFNARINPPVKTTRDGEIDKATLFESIPENFEKYNNLYNPKFPLSENRKFRCYIFFLYQKKPSLKESLEMYSKFDIIGQALVSEDMLISYWDKNKYPRTDIAKLVISILFPKYKEFDGPFIFFIYKHPEEFNPEKDVYVKKDFGDTDLIGKIKFFDYILSSSRKNKITSDDFLFPEFIVKLQSELRKLLKYPPIIELVNKIS